ncbi:MAG: SusC/RagA family TonB-linked outer membrane protein, partial [Bacteroidales bacterium]|nr:SusC/RagA family TonB-linked outer membrane protein [Bacteroidales bacterium]
MKKIVILATAVLLCITAIAQTRVTGTVTSSDDGTPVSFATIVVKGNNRLITSTDVDGRFLFPSIPGDAVLVVSSIGFSTVEVPVSSRTTLSIVISPDATSLEEVMVVAYGTVRRGSYSGSASVVRNDAIKDVPVISIEQALAGNVPGMQVTSQSGQPGSMPQIRVRGIGSFNAGNQPLYVVDGVPVTSGDHSTANIVTSSMNFLDPSNIESITVLKDAAAASLYGSRAANGVILITTKTGKQGKAVSTFKASYGFSDFAVYNYPMVSDQEREMLTKEMLRNYAEDTPSVWNNATYGSIDAYVTNRTEYYYPSFKPGWEYVDWRKKLFRTASAQNYEYSISGGSAESRVFASVAFNDTKGVSLNAHMNRISTNINASHKLSKKITVGGSMQYVITDQEGFQEGSGQRDNPWWAAVVRLTPRFAFKKPDGTYAHHGPASTESYEGTAFRNPYPDKDLQIANSKHYRTLLKGSVEVALIENLKLKSLISYDNTRVDDRFGWLVGHQYGEAYGKGYVGDRYNKIERIISSSTLNYNKTFAKKHNVALMVGWEAESMKRQYTDLSKVNFANYSLTSTYLAADVRVSGTRNDEQALLSFLSSFNYDYQAKYYLTATYRRDGSSKLGPENRWGDFWSLSGSWRLINESFMQPISWLNDLKLRGSYGVNGTLPPGYYDWQTLYGYGRYGGDNDSNPSTFADRGLTWETNYTWNVAIEGKVFDRFSFIGEYYSRTTKDLLLSASIPSITGFSSTTKNIGSMLNSGFELTLNVNILKKTDLKWDMGFNWSSLHNEVLSLSEDGEIQTSTPFIRTQGYSYYQYYTREYLGADPKTGLPMYYTNRPLTQEGVRGETEKEITNVTTNANSAILKGMTGLPKGFGGINTNLS